MVAALLTGEPIHLSLIPLAVIEPAIGGSEEVRAAWERLEAGSITVVPLRARAETFGVLALVDDSDRPPHGEMEIAVRYSPASSMLHVGGDWYDAFQQPDGATLLVMGDVVGHNVHAAAAMGQVRSILRGISCAASPTTGTRNRRGCSPGRLRAHRAADRHAGDRGSGRTPRPVAGGDDRPVAGRPARP